MITTVDYLGLHPFGKSSPAAELFKFFDITSYAVFFFFFNDTATTEIYTLSLHDALPILVFLKGGRVHSASFLFELFAPPRSEEHTSELQSPMYLVCRLLLGTHV